MVSLTSCGSFTQGLLAGLAECASYGYGYGGYSSSDSYASSSSSTTTVNSTAAEEAYQNLSQYQQDQIRLQQMNRELEQMTNNFLKETKAQRLREYEMWSRYNKKADGSTYTYDEYCVEMGKAIQMMKEEEGAAKSVDLTNKPKKKESYYSTRYGYRKCTLCKGSGTCSTCEGKGYFYSNYGVGEKNVCPNCWRKDGKPSGKCASCRGKGTVYGIKN